MAETKLVCCQRCGKPIGYVTVRAKTPLGIQTIRNAEVVAVCVNCRRKKFVVP
ncbi:MAG: hypothetical protein NWF05_02195 [Candidatus Bathyarchaeota archaeon]|nr:hypothetical protein [Candidatus Bathyarchaeota archaeon]